MVKRIHPHGGRKRARSKKLARAEWCRNYDEKRAVDTRKAEMIERLGELK
jgi:hypothetical protein